ncbi:MAG: SDR family NAD(P)-dependent oxidoreductase [Candidatus Hydrogenedentota bacterium]
MARLTALSRSVEGETVLVTGAASGMGRATAHLFADEGANVAAIDINEATLLEVVREIKDAGGTGEAWTLDLSDAAGIKRVIGEVAERFGGIDILVNNAGISLPARIDDEDYEEKWAKSVSVLLTAHTLTVRAALTHLRASDSPRIVNIASTEGMGATAGSSPYSACKHGVIGLTRSLAVELGKEGITVNCICPGPINTGMTQEIPEESKAIYARRRTALRRYGDPEEVAHATLNFALPASSFITGATLQVDGGLTIRRA